MDLHRAGVAFCPGLDIGFERGHGDRAEYYIAIGILDPVFEVDPGRIGGGHIVVCPVESEVEAFLGRVLYMDVQSALWIGIVIGRKAVVAGVVDMQGRKVGGGVAVDIDVCVGGYLVCAFGR